MIVHSRYVSGCSTTIVEADGPFNTQDIESEQIEYKQWLDENTEKPYQNHAYNAALVKWWKWWGSRDDGDYAYLLRYAKPKVFTKDGQYYKYGNVKITEGVKSGAEGLHPDFVYFDYKLFLEDNYNWVSEMADKLQARQDAKTHNKPRYSVGFSQAQGGNF